MMRAMASASAAMNSRICSASSLGWSSGSVEIGVLASPRDWQNGRALAARPTIIFCAMASGSKDVEKKLEALREKIRHHEYRYYVLDDPEISDFDFDKLMEQLKKLEAEYPALVTSDSPTRRVGGAPREGVVKVRHSSPMLSLDNTYSEEELRDWERRVHELTGRTDVGYVCELKLD